MDLKVVQFRFVVPSSLRKFYKIIDRMYITIRLQSLRRLRICYSISQPVSTKEAVLAGAGKNMATQRSFSFQNHPRTASVSSWSCEPGDLQSAQKELIYL